MFGITKKLGLLTSLSKNSFIPALLLLISVLIFYTQENIEPSSQSTLHIAFYCLSLISLSALFYFNQSHPAFFIILMTLSYFLINLFKSQFGEDYTTSAAYISLCFLAPINFLALYFLPNKKLFKKKNAYILLILLAQFSIVEKLSTQGISLGIGFLIGSLDAASLLLFFIIAIVLFINCSLSGKILTTAMFFGFMNIFLGFYYSDNSSALTIFFSTAALTVTIAILENFYHTTYKDVLTGLLSRNSFILQSKELPLKYSVGIIAIDNYENLKKAFNKKGINNIIKMVAELIDQSETPNIYRYTEDKFVLIFKNDTIKESFAAVEKIRRSIASSEFMVNKNYKNLKLTVSAGVSEKKRSDSDATSVLVRAHKALQKAYKFTQNVTTKA